MRVDHEARGRRGPSFPFPETERGRGDVGKIILINGDVPQIIVKAPDAVLVETECREGGGRE
jgi:hypothetical protein